MTDLSWLDAIEARQRAATEGPWRALTSQHLGSRRASYVETCWAHDLDGDDTELITDWCSYADAEFIASAPADIARLVKALRDAHAKLERVEALLPKFDAVYGPNGYVPVHVRAALAEEG